MALLEILSTFWGNFRTQIITALAILAVLGIAYWYWAYSQNKITTLTEQNNLLQATIQTQNNTISQLQQRFKQTQQELNNLNQKYTSITQTSTQTTGQLTFGPINDTNKNTVETQINQTYSNIFTTINNETQPSSFK